MSIEAQAELILSEIITDVEKRRAALDVLNTDQASWNSARLALKYIDELEGELKPTAVYHAVGLLYNRARDTIRRRVHVAKIFPDGVVKAHPKIHYSHFKVAADARHLKDPFESGLDIIWRIEGVLEAEGKCSVETVKSWVYQDDNEPVKTVWRRRTEGILAGYDYICDDEYAPIELRDLIGWFRGMLLSYMTTGVSPLMDDPDKTN